MLEPAQISKIAVSVARANLSPDVVSQVVTEPVTDSQGGDALRVTIVIQPDAADKLKGDSVLETVKDGICSCLPKHKSWLSAQFMFTCNEAEFADLFHASWTAQRLWT